MYVKVVPISQKKKLGICSLYIFNSIICFIGEKEWMLILFIYINVNNKRNRKALEECMRVLYYRDARTINKVLHHIIG
jgi:hypothetical protein